MPLFMSGRPHRVVVIDSRVAASNCAGLAQRVLALVALEHRRRHVVEHARLDSLHLREVAEAVQVLLDELQPLGLLAARDGGHRRNLGKRNDGISLGHLLSPSVAS